MSEKVEDGTVTLTCQSTSSSDEASFGKAVAQFQSLYAELKATSVKDIVELKSFKPTPNENQLASAVDQIKSQYPTVFIFCVMNGTCDSVTFIASSKEQCQSAIASFKLVVDNILH